MWSLKRAFQERKQSRKQKLRGAHSKQNSSMWLNQNEVKTDTVGKGDWGHVWEDLACLCLWFWDVE